MINKFNSLSFRGRVASLVLLLSFTASLGRAQAILEVPETDEADVTELNESLNQEALKVREKIEDVPSGKLSLDSLQTNLNYDTLSSIQKIYTPKTNRFAFYGGLGLVPNDVFYRTFSLNTKVSYFLNEKWGTELYGNLFSSAETADIKDLQNNQNLRVSQFIYMKSSYGLQLHYSSMYGKMAMLNERVVPFDMYEVLGVGLLRTSENRDETVFNLGFGQFFGLTRSAGLRWELSAFTFRSTNPASDQRTYNYFMFTVGYQGLLPTIGVRE